MSEGNQSETTGTSDCKHELSNEYGDDWEFSFKNPNVLPWEVRGPHPLLVKHKDDITQGRSGLKVLVPLCGRSDDMPWFVDEGHSVVGVEYDAEGCEGFFQVQGLEFTCSELGEGGNKVYKAKGKDITLYQCNFFHLLDLAPELKSSFDVIWDRAAIRTTVAVEDPKEGIQAYVNYMLELLARGGVFAVENTRFDTKRYTEMAALAGLVSDQMIAKICGDKWDIKKLAQVELKVGEAFEPVYKEMEHDVVLHILTPRQ